jgi:hypothetical protein
VILAAAGNDWHRPILVIAASYFVGALAWLGIDPVTPIASTDSVVPVGARTPATEGTRG